MAEPEAPAASKNDDFFVLAEGNVAELKAERSIMNTKQMFLSFVPWIAFTVLANRTGTQGAIAACLVATALAIIFFVKNSNTGSVKVIDITGTSGGTFTLAGNVPAINIARWDGLQWSALGSGLAGTNVKW